MKVAMFQSVEYDWMQTVADADDYSQRPDKWVLISNIVTVEFELINDKATQDAIKTKSIKAAQNRIEAAQVELDKLLEGE